MKLCIFSHRLNAERAEPFAEGLALSAKLGDRMGHFCGNHLGSVSGDRVRHLICYTETRSTR